MSILSGNGSGLARDEILEMESSIILLLGFKLNVNTLPFWCDYFSQQWDLFLEKNTDMVLKNMRFANQPLIALRSPQGNSYKYYREMMQIADVLILHS